MQTIIGCKPANASKFHSFKLVLLIVRVKVKHRVYLKSYRIRCLNYWTSQNIFFSNNENVRPRLKIHRLLFISHCPSALPGENICIYSSSALSMTLESRTFFSFANWYKICKNIDAYVWYFNCTRQTSIITLEWKDIFS